MSSFTCSSSVFVVFVTVVSVSFLVSVNRFCTLVPSPSDGQGDDVEEERDVEAEGDHPGLEKEHAKLKPDEHPGRLRLVLPTPELYSCNNV